MKISPLPSSGVPTFSGAAEASAPVSPSRSLVMHTNATPLRGDLSEKPLGESANAEPEATEPLSPQFAALAKQRRALQQERQVLEREKAQAKSSTQVDSIAKAQLKSDPLGTLLGLGLTWDDLTKAVTDYQSGPNSRFQEFETRFKTLEETFDKKLTDREHQAEQQALGEIRKEASMLIAQGDEFEAIRETRSLPHVMTLIERVYREKGQLLSTREALKLVEDDLINESITRARFKKVQSQLAPPAPLAPQPQQRFMRTLTNRDTAQVPLDRKARALAAALGQQIKR